MSIAFTVNGTAAEVAAAPTPPPLAGRRNPLDPKGPRYGGGLDQCGACMVLVDGEPVFACAREVGTVAGRRVATVE